MKIALADHHRNAGAITATRFILAQLDDPSQSTKH
jgi:hypothetical protein